MRSIKIAVSWILVLSVMIVIFMFSSQTAEESGAASGGVLAWLYGVFERILGIPCFADPYGTIGNGIFRKIAHFIIYLLLGFFSANAFYQSGFKRIFVISVLISFLYAITDEVHQLFVPGRSGEIRDVLIDTSGAVFGILVFMVIMVLRRKIWISKKQ